jgi:hypothetical protein
MLIVSLLGGVVLASGVIAQPDQVAMASLSIESSKVMVVDTAQNKPESLEVAMRGIFARVSIADFDVIVDGSVETLVKLDKNAEARLVRDIALKIKAANEAGVTVKDPPPEFRIHTENPPSAS